MFFLGKGKKREKQQFFFACNVPVPSLPPSVTEIGDVLHTQNFEIQVPKGTPPCKGF
jgi:hypothetical protein